MEFLLIGGMVRSANDGDEHYVGPVRLMELYGLRRSECILARDDPDATRLTLGMPEERRKRLVILRPSHLGDYTLPKRPSREGGTER